MHNAFVAVVDAFEVDAERLVVTFADRVGAYWLLATQGEMVQNLRTSQRSGSPVEVTFAVATQQIVDVVERSE